MTVPLLLSQSILVVSPYTVLLIASFILLVDLSCHLFGSRMVLHFTTTPFQRSSIEQHQIRITALRIASNRLNSPGTFAEYAKTQRALQKELKLQDRTQQEIAQTTSPIKKAVLTFLFSHGAKMVTCMVCFMACVGRTLFIVPADGWIGTLSYTPVRVRPYRHRTTDTNCKEPNQRKRKYAEHDSHQYLTASPLSLSLSL